MFCGVLVLIRRRPRSEYYNISIFFDGPEIFLPDRVCMHEGLGLIKTPPIRGAGPCPSLFVYLRVKKTRVFTGIYDFYSIIQDCPNRGEVLTGPEKENNP